ncbi:MAG: DUF6252 family protein [Rhodothermales bacterium]
MNNLTHRFSRLLLVMTLLVFVAACDSNDDEEQQQLANGFMNARIEGQSWNANVTVFAIAQGGVFGVSGADASGKTIGLGGLAQLGPQTIGPTSPANATYSETAGATVVQWSAGIAAGSGTITVTELDGTHIAGTFSYVAEASATTGATGTKTITEGSFDIKLGSIDQ